MAHEQLVEFRFVAGESFGKHHVGRHQHGVHFFERQRRIGVGDDQAQFEFRACEMNDVVFFEELVALHALAVNEGAVSAVFVRQTNLAGDVARQGRVLPAESEIGNDQIVLLAPTDAIRQPGNDELDPSAVIAEGFQRPLFFQNVTLWLIPPRQDGPRAWGNQRMAFILPRVGRNINIGVDPLPPDDRIIPRLAAARP